MVMNCFFHQCSAIFTSFALDFGGFCSEKSLLFFQNRGLKLSYMSRKMPERIDATLSGNALGSKWWFGSHGAKECRFCCGLWCFLRSLLAPRVTSFGTVWTKQFWVVCNQVTRSLWLFCSWCLRLHLSWFTKCRLVLIVQQVSLNNFVDEAPNHVEILFKHAKTSNLEPPGWNRCFPKIHFLANNWL